jgi:NAD(P) transhydrogenase subunit alpha
LRRAIGYTPKETQVRIGIPRESRTGETLVAATSATATQLLKLGYEVVVESGAGESADQPDAAFEAAEVSVGSAEDVWSSDIVVKVNAPTTEEIGRLRRGATIISMMAPMRSPELVDALVAAGVTALAMDAVPRISRAQSMDVLSSMANVAGYRAVIEGAHAFGRQFTGQVTAAGKVPPAKVFVVGAGVAGLAAIGAAGSMGAIVRAFDVRPEVAEQVESMGAQFVSVDMESEVSTDGYAKEMTAEQEAATAVMYDEEARGADIVITTALIPGRPAPKLITAETIANMRTGSVIIDMAAANGGNTELTRTDEVVTTDNGVTIIGYTDLAGRLPAQTSQLYGTNIVNLLKLMTPEKDGNLVLDLDDVIVRGITVSRDGESMWPPPPVQVSAAPAATTAAAPAEPDPNAGKPKVALTARAKVFLVLGAIGLFGLINALAPTEDLRRHFTVLMLSIVIGYYVIGKVAHALHTPLMSVTNAISGVVVVGALVQINSEDTTVLILSTVAILLASINIFGGFAVTRRMLGMFSKGA